MENSEEGHRRREVLTGKALQGHLQQTQDKLADAVSSEANSVLQTGDTVRLSTRAMACDFSVILNPSSNRRQVIDSSDSLEWIHQVEDRLTVYRPQSELIDLNRAALGQPATGKSDLIELLARACEIAVETSGAYTPTAGALNRLWRECRKQSKVPLEEDLKVAVEASRYEHVSIDRTAETIQINHPDLLLDMSGMGKGFGLDVVADALKQQKVSPFLIHGGHSSILACGDHLPEMGWPVGIRHPQIPGRRIATLQLFDEAFSASGSGVQFFRYQGERYGHIFDPRSGWPVDHHLSMVVVTDSAATADALSTAFFVMTTDEVVRYCERHPKVSAILFPTPKPGKKLVPLILGMDESRIHWE